MWLVCRFLLGMLEVYGGLGVWAYCSPEPCVGGIVTCMSILFL